MIQVFTAKYWYQVPFAGTFYRVSLIFYVIHRGATSQTTSTLFHSLLAGVLYDTPVYNNVSISEKLVLEPQKTYSHSLTEVNLNFSSVPQGITL